MPQQIILTDDARQSFRTIVGGQGVRITAWWNVVDGRWYLTLSRLDRTVIAAGLRLVEGGRPLRGVMTDFAGELIVDGMGEPGRHAWAGSHRLLYLSPDEI